MSRTPASFTQADVARALRAARAVGVNVTVEIVRGGTIRLVPVTERPETSPEPPLEPRRKIVL